MHGPLCFHWRRADTKWLPPGINLDSKGFVQTGQQAAESGAGPLQRQSFLLETTVPGVFAAGDVRQGSIKRVAAAVGEGSMAVQFVPSIPGRESKRRSAAATNHCLLRLTSDV